MPVHADAAGPLANKINPLGRVNKRHAPWEKGHVFAVEIISWVLFV